MIEPGSALNLESVIPYLLRRGYITVKEVVRNGVKVHEITQRNGNFRVERRSGDWLLLKQAREPNAIRTVAWEARTYRAFQSLSVSHPLRRYTVPFLDYDAEEGVLFLRCIPRAYSLTAFQRQGRFPVGPAIRIGHALAALHSFDLASPPLNALSEVLLRRRPHALFLHRPDHMFYCNASSGNLQAVRFIQSFPAFGVLVDTLAEEWQPTCLIHFDVKGGNILVFSMRGAHSVWLIDWGAVAEVVEIEVA